MLLSHKHFNYYNTHYTVIRYIYKNILFPNKLKCIFNCKINFVCIPDAQ